MTLWLRNLRLIARWSLASRVLVAASFIACGRSGDETTKPAPELPPEKGGVVNPEVKAVSGGFLVDDQPADGAELWLFDHSEPKLARLALDGQGGFRVPINEFQDGHSYSFHFVKDYIHVADLDFSAETPGIQGRLMYQGGYGFDLGTVKAALDKHGDFDTDSMLAGQFGGGFQLDRDGDGSFSSFPMPAELASLSFGHQLIVFDPTSLLYSFFRKSLFPALYARDLSRFSRVTVRANAASADKIGNVHIVGGRSWLKTARGPADQDQATSELPFWRLTDFELQSISPLSFQATVYPEFIPSTGEITVFRIHPLSGNDFDVPAKLSRVLSMPPKVIAASGDGDSAIALDYLASGAVDGLTNPLCQSGDVALEVEPPRDSGFSLIGSAFDSIQVGIDYYGTKNGATVQLLPSPSAFPAPFSAEVEDKSLPLERDWDPSSRTIKFALDKASAGASVHDLAFWNGLFPNMILSQSVTKVRLRIYYQSSSEATISAAAFWLAKGC